WSHYDSVVGEAAKNGIRVLATVYSSPTWAEPTPEYPPLGSRLRDFEDFVRAAARRYGSNGTFWKQNPGISKLPIVDWEAWNEPNSPLFWKPAPDARGYLQLLRGFSSAVRGVDPNAQILLGGLFSTPKDGIVLNSFLSRLYDGGAKDLFDAAAVHPYAATPQQAISSVALARQIMDRHDDPDASLWITEIGWASGGRPSGLTVGPRGQADYLRQTFEMAADDRERLKLDGVVWFALNDTPGPLWPGHCGLFTLDGTAKPSWHALVDLTGGET
ncbi:MAG: hypothetical protein WBQ41_01175, partial [Solirubrobacterales bacterium]